MSFQRHFSIPTSAALAGIALAGAAVVIAASARDGSISADRMLAHVKYLASDDLEGRAPGSRGEQLTVTYVVDQLEKAGCTPGNPDGSFTQKVPLYGFQVVNSPALVVRDKEGTNEKQYAAGKEFVGWTVRQVNAASVRDAELMFVGYGVDAPEYQWNDFKTDVRGKVIVILVNDPPLPDPSLFGGKAMTYYGRWTYKYEQAAALGAAGAIIVHNTVDAGYPWAVVENSWSGEQFDVVRADQGASRCALESWITEDAARDLFKAAGRNFDDDKRAAASRDFQPVALARFASADIKTRSRTIESSNVVASVKGSNKADEWVVYTAHWDHLGIGKPADNDSIYNGALDNASGVAGVMEIARAFASHGRPLGRSVLFIFTTGEESGLLGATHYTNHPLYPLEKTIAEINVDGLNIWGRTEDMIVVGFGQSDLEQTLADAILPMNRRIAPDSEPEKGYYYRSDHFPFAKKGVPALYADSGVEYRDRPAGWGLERRKEYVARRYHKPQDQYDATWDLSGAAEDMEALFRVGLTLSNSEATPQWSEKSEFRRVRDAMMRGSK
ncbi:MAG: M28 family peptidase [Candidatus Latescibacteria bacterium]|nr:M28 family peptidase [Candidatus Latescibacterota bacterium]